jgi:hypothetical protein
MPSSKTETESTIESRVEVAKRLVTEQLHPNFLDLIQDIGVPKAGAEMSLFKTTTNRSTSIVDDWGVHVWIKDPNNCDKKLRKSIYWICLHDDCCKATLDVCSLKKPLKIAKGSTMYAT